MSQSLVEVIALPMSEDSPTFPGLFLSQTHVRERLGGLSQCQSAAWAGRHNSTVKGFPPFREALPTLTPPPQQTQGSSICLLPQLLPCCDDVVPFFSTCDPSQGAFLKSSLHTQGLKQRWASFHSLSHTAHTDLVLTLSQALEIGAE